MTCPKPVVYLVVSIILVLGLTAWARAELTYTPVSFFFTTRAQNWEPQFPMGDQTFGGIPFGIPTSGNNTWHSEYAADSIPRYLDISLNIFGVHEVHTLINTWWGQEGTYNSLEFWGSDNAYYKVDLYGNSDIRDYNNDGWTNNINGTTTTNVWQIDNQYRRIDKQFIALPADFWDENLTSIRFSDTGAGYYTRGYLYGVTVGAVPLPSALLLFGTGLLPLVGWRSFRKG
jgi:hypothetical protein